MLRFVGRWVCILGFALFLIGCAAVIEYTVAPGDSLQTIALKFNTTVPELVTLNQDRYPDLSNNPRSLKAGAALRVPSKTGVGQMVGEFAADLQSRWETFNGPTPNAPAPPNASFASKLEETDALILELINEARIKNRLKPLTTEPTLDRIALTRSQDMIARNYFSHDDPATGRVAFEDLINAHRYSYRFAGENIAEIRNEAAIVMPNLTVAQRYDARALANQFVTGWLNSPEHRENIMKGDYHRTGIAASTNEGGTRITATQVFSD